MGVWLELMPLFIVFSFLDMFIFWHNSLIKWKNLTQRVSFSTVRLFLIKICLTSRTNSDLVKWFL